MSGVSLHKHLHRILEEKMLPSVRGGTSVTLLQAPLFTTNDEHLNITSLSAPPLPRARPERSHIALHLWPEQFLNSLRVPYLACVFEGEADIALRSRITSVLLRAVGLSCAFVIAET